MSGLRQRRRGSVVSPTLLNRNPLTANKDVLMWTQIPGRLAQISAGSDGSVWGITGEGLVYRYDRARSAWEQVPGELKQLAVGDASRVWGVREDGQIFRYVGGDLGWENVPGTLAHIAVAGNDVWGVNADGSVWRLASAASAPTG